MTKQNDNRSTTPPDAVLKQMIGGGMVTQMIYVAAKLGIADLLKDGPKDSDALAESTETHPQTLYRLMRTLASIGIFAESKDRQFILTPLAIPLQADAPGSVRNFALWAGEVWTWQLFGELLYSVRTGKPVFTRIFGQGIDEYFAQNPESAKIFNQLMLERTQPNAVAVAEAYNFSKIDKLVDVGGGCGILLTTILKENPHLSGVLFDLPHVIKETRDTIEQEGVINRCELVSGDFFETVPVGGDAYILSQVIHDWDDDQAITILKNCRRHMPMNGRLLLLEYVILPDNAPSPGRISDIIMLVTEGGRERTELEFRALFETAGFRLTNIIPTQSGINVIEGVPI
jgi:hypothetical protein